MWWYSFCGTRDRRPRYGKVQGYSDVGRDQQDKCFQGRKNDQSPGNIVGEELDHGVHFSVGFAFGKSSRAPLLPSLLPVMFLLPKFSPIQVRPSQFLNYLFLSIISFYCFVLTDCLLFLDFNVQQYKNDLFQFDRYFFKFCSFATYKSGLQGSTSVTETKRRLGFSSIGRCNAGR
jgi:hypothetical protein